MELSLKVLAGKFAGKEIRVSSAKFVIGRADDCQLRALSGLISRHHCALLIDAYSARVQDLNSRNGTFVNDEPIQGERQLQSGDRLTVGQLKFEVHLKSELGGPKRPKVVDIKDAAERTVEAVAQNDDAEVASWINEAPQALSDTHPGKAADTTTISTTENPLDDGQLAAADSTIVGGSRGERPRPTAPAASQAKDSQEAAADILRKFMKNRR